MFRSCIVCVCLLLFAGAACGQTTTCSIETFEVDAKRSRDACSEVLNSKTLADGERAQSLKIRARSFHKLGNIQAAIEDYEAALKLAPNDPELHLRRGWTAVDDNEPQQAYKHARRALELRPGYPEVYNLIGVLHGKAERRDDELKAYGEAIRLDPNEPLVRSNRLRALKRSERYAEALKEAESILSLPASAITKPLAIVFYLKPTTHRIAAGQQRGELLRMLGRKADAQRAFDEAVELDPHAQTFAGRAANSLKNSTDEIDSPEFRRIQDDVNRSIALDPDFWRSREIQGKVHFYSERYDDAAREFARGIELYPINGTMRWWHAFVLKKLGRLNAATEEAFTAFKVDRGFMLLKLPMLRERGYLPDLRREGEVAAAIHDAVRACVIDAECF
jgi:tetratricopeptide (TPR) repeat protein